MQSSVLQTSSCIWGGGGSTPRFWRPTTPPTNYWPEGGGGGGLGRVYSGRGERGGGGYLGGTCPQSQVLINQSVTLPAI